jgi:hypothetical protein
MANNNGVLDKEWYNNLIQEERTLGIQEYIYESLPQERSGHL